MSAAARPAVNWQGVFPAVTTQFREDFSLDIDATAQVMAALIRDGVSGLIVCGTVGETSGRGGSNPVRFVGGWSATLVVAAIAGVAGYLILQRATPRSA